MSPTLFLVIGIAFVLSCLPLMFLLSRSYRRFRGLRLVICPETLSPETVTLDARHAAWTSVTGDPELHPISCSRHPRGCSEKCVEQIEASPTGCLVRKGLENWCEESQCAICGRPIGRIRWLGRRPGLIGPDQRIRRWSELTDENLPELLSTHRPVCARCVAVGATRHAVENRSGTAA